MACRTRALVPPGKPNEKRRLTDDFLHCNREYFGLLPFGLRARTRFERSSQPWRAMVGRNDQTAGTLCIREASQRMLRTLSNEKSALVLFTHCRRDKTQDCWRFHCMRAELRSLTARTSCSIFIVRMSKLVHTMVRQLLASLALCSVDQSVAAFRSKIQVRWRVQRLSTQQRGSVPALPWKVPIFEAHSSRYPRSSFSSFLSRRRSRREIQEGLHQ